MVPLIITPEQKKRLRDTFSKKFYDQQENNRTHAPIKYWFGKSFPLIFRTITVAKCYFHAAMLYRSGKKCINNGSDTIAYRIGHHLSSSGFTVYAHNMTARALISGKDSLFDNLLKMRAQHGDWFAGHILLSKALDKNDPNKIRLVLKQNVRNGDPLAAFWLAETYRTGRFGPDSPKIFSRNPLLTAHYLTLALDMNIKAICKNSLGGGFKFFSMLRGMKEETFFFLESIVSQQASIRPNSKIIKRANAALINTAREENRKYIPPSRSSNFGIKISEPIGGHHTYT